MQPTSLPITDYIDILIAEVLEMYDELDAMPMVHITDHSDPKREELCARIARWNTKIATATAQEATELMDQYPTDEDVDESLDD